MDDPDKNRAYLARYIKRNGGLAAVSKASGIPYSTLAGVCNGNRGIGRDLARRLSRHDPSLKEGRLLMVLPESVR